MLLTATTDIVSVITSLVGSLGFPIVISLLLLRQNEKLEERHEKETQSFTKVITDNTIAIEKLTAVISERSTM